MRTFLRFSLICMVYAFILFIVAEGMVNRGRIQDITGYSFEQIDRFILVGTLILVGLLTCLCIYLTKLWLTGRGIALWSVILWFPFWLIFILGFAYLFPNYNQYDNNPASGLIIIGMILFYPLYVGITVALGIAWGNNKQGDEL